VLRYVSTIVTRGNYPKWVTLIAFTDSALDAQELVGALRARGMSAQAARAARDTPASGGVAETAAALIASERLLVERRPEAVVVAGVGNTILAAAIAASKLEIPLVSVPGKTAARGSEGERNAHLMRLLAGLAVDPDDRDPADAIQVWLAAGSRAGTGPADR